MLYNSQNEIDKKKYKKILSNIGSLSFLFTESSNAYLNYRVHENTYCYAFSATNLSRSDIAIDATYEKVGIGLKTFLRLNNNTYQKIAEFNALSGKLNGKKTSEKVKLIKKWRNDRLSIALKLYGLESMIYHCIIRDEIGFHVYEESMDFIEETTDETEDEKTIKFKSGSTQYSYNKSKNTLMKKFVTCNIIDTIQIENVINPLEKFNDFDLKKILIENVNEKVILPLYSTNTGQVQVRSGLNQWNANGRKRNPDEVYIPIPRNIHISHPKFFPARDQIFDLILPNGTEMSAKVCQDGSKALMSNPNKELGSWLLRSVLNLQSRELLTKEVLLEKGFDSVQIEKIEKNKYKIDIYINKEDNEGN